MTTQTRVRIRTEKIAPCFLQDAEPGWYEIHSTNRGHIGGAPGEYHRGDVILLTSDYIANISQAFVEPIWNRDTGGGYIRITPLGARQAIVEVTAI
jgi:hypothetical protein